MIFKNGIMHFIFPVRFVHNISTYQEKKKLQLIDTPNVYDTCT